MKWTLLFCALALNAVMVRADDLTGRLGAGGAFGVGVPAGPKSITDRNDAGADVGGWLRYGFSDFWSARLAYDSLAFRNGSTRARPLMLTAGLALDSRSDWNPTLYLGAGALSITDDVLGRRTEFSPTVGYGIDYFVTRRLSVGGVVDWFDTLRSKDSLLTFRYGVAVGLWFGGPTAKVKAGPHLRLGPGAGAFPQDSDKSFSAASKLPAEKVSMNMSIHFDRGEAVVKPEYDGELKKVADFLKTYPNAAAEIEGHTDGRGGRKMNRQLSQRRADNVRQALIDRFGADAAHLTAKGYGPDKPIADNATPEGRALNRRVVATFTAAQQAPPHIVLKSIVLSDEHFDFDKSTLKPEGMAALRKNVKLLKDNPNTLVRVAGYTSMMGTAEYNRKLSERRAVSVENFLVREGGIAPGRITTIGYGATNPATYEATPGVSDTAAAKSNMRVLFEITVK